MRQHASDTSDALINLLKPSKSPICEETWYDPVNRQNIQMILNNSDHFKLKSTTRSKLVAMDKRMHFGGARSKAGQLSQSYRQKYDSQRIYTSTANSMQYLPKKIRPFVTNEVLIELDGINMGPSIFAAICHQLKLATPKLSEYITERSKFLASMQNWTNVKNLCYVFMHGGSYKTWAENNECKLLQSDMYLDLEQEVKGLVETVHEALVHVVDDAGDAEDESAVEMLQNSGTGGNMTGKFISMIIQRVEIKVLSTITTFLRTADVICDNVAVFVHDAIIFPSNNAWEAIKSSAADELMELLNVKYKVDLNLKWRASTLRKDTTNNFAYHFSIDTVTDTDTLSLPITQC